MSLHNQFRDESRSCRDSGEWGRMNPMKRCKWSLPIRCLVTGALVFLVALCLVVGAPLWYRRNFNWEFISAAGSGDIQKVRAELDAGVPPDQPHWQGASAMSFAAFYGREEVVKLLLARGADPNGGMRQAKSKGYINIVCLLQRAGAK